jgi:glutamate synthase (NADPH/NADH) large chain
MSKHLTADEAQRLRAAEARAATRRAAQSRCNDGFVAGPGLGDARLERDSCGVGFIADLKGGKSHDIIANGLQILGNLTHRGAVGADPLVGDGAGMLAQIPHDLFRAECGALGFSLPAGRGAPRSL